MKFLLKDLTGRGMRCTHNKAGILNAMSETITEQMELMEDEEIDRDSIDFFPDWLENAEVGDTWEDATQSVTRTK